MIYNPFARESLGSSRLNIIWFTGLFILFSCNHQYSSDRSAKDFNETVLDSLFQNAVLNHEIPSAAVYVIHKGKEVYHKGFGWQNIASDKPLQTNSLFRIASMTKVVTAVSLMQLMEKGLLSLDDPLSKYLPEYSNPRILVEVKTDSTFTSRPATREITLRELVAHTSGIAYGFQSEMYNALVVKNGITEGFEERPILLRENVKKIAALPLMHEPGEQYTYSLGMDVAGAVVEVVSGESLDEYFYKHIFKPLGMTDSYFYLPDEKAGRLVSVYEHNADRTGFIPTTYPYTEYPVQGARMYLSGGADLCSTVKDIGIFAQMMLNKGNFNGTQVLGEKYVNMITSKQSDHGWENYDIGLGVSVVNKAGGIKGPMSEGSYDWGGFFDTYCWVDPQKNVIAILLLQMYPTNEFEVHQKFQHLVYKIIDNDI